MQRAMMMNNDEENMMMMGDGMAMGEGG